MARQRQWSARARRPLPFSVDADSAYGSTRRSLSVCPEPAVRKGGGEGRDHLEHAIVIFLCRGRASFGSAARSSHFFAPAASALRLARRCIVGRRATTACRLGSSARQASSAPMRTLARPAVRAIARGLTLRWRWQNRNPTRGAAVSSSRARRVVDAAVGAPKSWHGSGGRDSDAAPHFASCLGRRTEARHGRRRRNVKTQRLRWAIAAEGLVEDRRSLRR